MGSGQAAGVAPTAAAGAPHGRAARRRGADTRARLVAAAIEEFAAQGFDGASTRSIAARAGVHQPQINYHFSSKEDLWRAAVDHLFRGIAAELEPAAVVGVAELEPAAALAELVGRFVRSVARHPALHRLMTHEATTDSDRLAWIVDGYVRPFFERVGAAWRALHPEADDLDLTILHYVLVGSATLLHVHAPEARRLSGIDPADPLVVDRQVALLTRLLGLPLPEPEPPEGNSHGIPPGHDRPPSRARRR